MKSDPIKFCLCTGGLPANCIHSDFLEFLSGKFFLHTLILVATAYKQVFAGTWYLARTMLTEGFTGWSWANWSWRPYYGVDGRLGKFAGSVHRTQHRPAGTNICLSNETRLGWHFFLFLFATLFSAGKLQS